MRGAFDDQGRLFSYMSPEQWVPARHPLRAIRELVREVLGELDGDFRKLYSTTGRPSIPPEQLLSALLLQVFYGVRSERQLMEQLDYNLLYRWFVGLSPDDAVWDATTFTKNRERLQHGDVFNRFMERLLRHKDVIPLLSDEHFSVDGTLIEAWAVHKRFKPKDAKASDGEPCQGTRRKNATHASTTDPDSRLYRKSEGKESKLCYMGHATMENRNGLAVAGLVTQASGMATSIDGRTTRHTGYRISQGKRNMIECLFGWGKQHGTMRKTKHRGLARVAADFLLNLIGYNLIRIPKLLAQRG
jgi:transposase